MIYINDKAISKDELLELSKPLKELAPDFFRQDSPKGVQLSYSPSAMSLVVRSQGLGNRAPQASVMRAPEPTSMKSKTYRIDKDGMREEIVYSDSAPYADKNGKMRYRGASIVIAHDTYLRPVVDLEKFVYLYHFSGMFTNGVGGRSSSRFTFVIPDLINKARVNDENGRKLNMLQGQILYGGLDIAKVKSVMTAMSLPLEGSDDTLRTRLFDFIVKGKDVFNDGAYEQYISLTDPKVNVDTVAEITEMVNLALTKGKLTEVENQWCFVGKNGTAGRPFAPVASEDKEAALIKVFTSDENALQRLEKALADL